MKTPNVYNLLSIDSLISSTRSINACEVDTIQFNSIQNSLFSTQHIVHTTMFLAYDVLKRERAEDSSYVGSFPNIII